MKDEKEPTAGRVLSEPVTITVIDSSSQSTDATLSNLQVNGTTITGFSTNKEIYDIELPEGTNDVPVVMATTTDVNADAQVSDAASLPGSTSVLVTAEDGVTTKTYTISFTVAPSSDATLSDLSINDTTVTDFSASKEVYDIELPFGTTDIPNVSATATDINATVSVNNSPTLPGTASILVTAENSVTTKTYTINFTVASPSVSIDKLNVSNTEFAKIYPNPAKEFLNIDFATTGKRKIELLNSVGQQIYSVQTTDLSTEIDLKSLDIKGFVIVQVETDNSVANRKVIVR
jgi:hypothetical protein